MSNRRLPVRPIAALLLPLAALAAPAAAQDFGAAMTFYLDSQIRGWANDPVLIRQIRAQNQRTAGLSQAEIDALDQEWRAEVSAADRPTIEPVLHNPAADFLRRHVDASDGTITEIFAMDARGLNVAATGVTSDYWQGDEDKFQQTYDQGPDAVHLGAVEFDESTQSYQGQISLTLVDPDTGEEVGALTVGVDAESLF